ncbi:hypothetical protein GOV13_01385 [Candidatus Pacearchaeota archaeon]|nr:hypothetical protein [Candidatus Pacearchaeota archaeon]
MEPRKYDGKNILHQGLARNPITCGRTYFIVTEDKFVRIRKNLEDGYQARDLVKTKDGNLKDASVSIPVKDSQLLNYLDSIWNK